MDDGVLRDGVLRDGVLRDGVLRDGVLRNGVLRIDCDECSMAGTGACADCLVTFLCRSTDGVTERGAERAVERGGERVVVIDAAEARALRLLRDAGLAPALRHRARDQGSQEHRMVRSR